MTPYGLGAHFATRLGERIRLKLRAPQAYGLFIILPGLFSHHFVSSKGFIWTSGGFDFKWQVDVPRLGIHVRLNSFPHLPPRNAEILFISMQDTRTIPMYLLSASHCTNLQSNSPIWHTLIYFLEPFWPYASTAFVTTVTACLTQIYLAQRWAAIPYCHDVLVDTLSSYPEFYASRRASGYTSSC